MEMSELKEMSKADLIKKEDELREDVFRMKMKLATGELEDTSQVKKTRRDIARIQTVLSQKETEA